MSNKKIQVGDDGKVFRLVEGQKPVPVLKWSVDAEGNRRPTDQQEVDESGLPKWTLPVVLQTMSYGRLSPELVDLVYSSVDGEIPGDSFV